MKKEEENCPNYQKIEVIFVFISNGKPNVLFKENNMLIFKKCQPLFSVFNIIIQDYIIINDYYF